MNVGVFSKVNNRDSRSTIAEMYGEWSSLPLEGGGEGVLGTLRTGGKDVVLAIVRQLATPGEPSRLNTDSDVEWVLEVIRYGLSLPLSEHECVRECVRVCVSWLCPLLPPSPQAQPPPPPVPTPVLVAPHRYARKILSHLHNLFVPRPGECGDLISKQAVLCHWVLRVCRSLACSGNLGASEWKSLLVLLLSAAAALLAPPHAPLTADQLCDRVLSVLFEVWILACHRSFPTPPLWRTLREQCQRWRHRSALTEQWSRVTLSLTARLLSHIYGPLYPKPTLNEEDVNLIPTDMTADAVSQTWYRMLHTIGNPVELCRPHVISQTPDFLQYALAQEEGSKDPSQHPCLQALPGIFLRAMKGVSAHVDAFLGMCRTVHTEVTGSISPLTQHRPLAKSFSVSSQNSIIKPKIDIKGLPRTSLAGLTSNRPVSTIPATPPNSLSSQDCEVEYTPLATLRPKVNSILHLFGEWLFEAALIGTPGLQVTNQLRTDGTPPPPIVEPPTNILIQNYQPGRAEALGALCRVLCSKKSREEVTTVYAARCYMAIYRGLKDSATAASVVINAQDIFRVDLDGVLILLPEFLSALEKILPEREPKLNCDGIDKFELRKAAVNLLLSMIALPHHFKGLPIPEFPGNHDYKGLTFGDLTGRMSLVCVSAVQTENNSILASQLLSALYLCVRHSPYNTDNTNSTVRSESVSGSGEGSLSIEEIISTDAFIRDHNMFGAALVLRATYLVCHRLISSWKGDLQVSLAALELLSGLAKLHSNKSEVVERGRAVRWICDYISLQCGRQPTAHSRDLHSCVVCAYHCLAAWLCPRLLADTQTLHALLQVVELGLSGSKSEKPGEAPKMKDEKELKPVSMRVRDAAEALLMLIMEQVEAPPNPCQIDERWLAARGHGKLRYFLVDDCILLSLLEEPLNNSQEPQPTLVLLSRSAWGSMAWSVSSRSRARSSVPSPAPHRPLSIHSAPHRPATHCRHLPHGPPCAVDAAFPSLESVLHQLNDPDAPQLFKLLEKQAQIEREVRESAINVTPEEFVPPEPVTEFQTARMFLCNFGYLSIGDEKKVPKRLVALDSEASGFKESLRRLDSTASRFVVTCHIFCCRAGQSSARDILSNVLSNDAVPAGFLNMLRGVGWPVRVKEHKGWCGNVNTTLNNASDNTAAVEDPEEKLMQHGGSLYDGREQILYWADTTSEIAFIVPSLNMMNTVGKDDTQKSELDGNCINKSSDKGASCWDVSSNTTQSEPHEREGSAPPRPTLSDKMRTMSLDLDKPPNASTNFGTTGSGRRMRQHSTKILIIWLEDYEDHNNIPIDELLSYCETGETWRRSEVCVIWCYGGALSGGPLRLAGPHTLHGATAAPYVLPEMLRHVALTAARRKTLQHDSYQPPHARRRHLIQELAQQYKKNLTEPELLESLFMDP